MLGYGVNASGIAIAYIIDFTIDNYDIVVVR